jgi:hypothetical protein
VRCGADAKMVWLTRIDYYYYYYPGQYPSTVLMSTTHALSASIESAILLAGTMIHEAAVDAAKRSAECARQPWADTVRLADVHLAAWQAAATAPELTLRLFIPSIGIVCNRYRYVHDAWNPSSLASDASRSPGDTPLVCCRTFLLTWCPFKLWLVALQHV